MPEKTTQWTIWLKWALWISLSIFSIIRCVTIEPYPTGDGVEYVLTTEAFYQHFTPDLRTTDVDAFQEAYTHAQPWEKNEKAGAFAEMKAFLQQDSVKQFAGIYTTDGGKRYGYHFSAYSLVNVPARAVLGMTGGNPLAAFQWTNALLVILVLGFVLFRLKITPYKAMALALAYYFSAVFYYLGWTHPEIFTASLIFVGLLLFWEKKELPGILLISIATMQNQPLALLVAFLSIVYLYQHKFRLRTWIALGLRVWPVIVPPLFYLIQFGTTNLIKDAGFLSAENITWTRFEGFFFDLNQGMILGLGLMVPAYLGMLLVEAVQLIRKKRKPDYWLFLPGVMVALTLVVCMMSNWNHGMAIVNRYAVWIGILLLVHFFQLLKNYGFRMQIAVYVAVILSQMGMIRLHSPGNQYDWSSVFHQPFGKWMVEHHPGYYNPDPQIFISRTLRKLQFTPEDSPVFYFQSAHWIPKVAVHREKLEALTELGVSRGNIEKIRKQTYLYGWTYLNDWGAISTMSAEDVYQKQRLLRLKAIRDNIYGNETWLKGIQEKADQKGITLEQAVEEDANYILSEEEKSSQ